MSLEKVPVITLGTTTTREPENLLFLVKVTILSTFPKRWNICNKNETHALNCQQFGRQPTLPPVMQLSAVRVRLPNAKYLG
jgi:hypothetical protein